MVHRAIPTAQLLAFSMIGLSLLGSLAAISAAEREAPKLPMEIPVLVVKYFPVKGDRIDQKVTGDWGAPLEETRKKTEQLTEEVIAALQEGSRYHGYKDKRRQAQPCLQGGGDLRVPGAAADRRPLRAKVLR